MRVRPKHYSYRTEQAYVGWITHHPKKLMLRNHV